jgi:ribosome-associated protein
MEGMSSTNSRKVALELAALAEAHGGLNVVVLDMGTLASWTDFFVIATVTSVTHMKGVMKFVKEFLAEKGVDVYRRSSAKEDEEWLLVDCGDIVLHLMNARAREFYELEKLWFQAERLKVPSGER